MKTEFITKIGRSFKKVGFKIEKHSPEMLVVAGVIGGVTAAVMACKATTKLSAVIDDCKDQVNKVDDVLADESISEEKYSEEDAKKDRVIIYTQTAVKVAKLYGPSVILGALSITGIFASNNILRKRNVALAAAYATVDSTFKKYRERVIDKFGEEVDKQLKYGVKAVEVEEQTVDKETGEVKTEKKTVNVVDMDPNGYSAYSKFFDETNPNWVKNAEDNLFFLRAQQNWANDKLKADGRLFLNDVYKSIGIEPTKAGQIVGWVYDPENPVGDNFVDFGIYDCSRERARSFVNGTERCILLDFNVDGNIWEMM